MRIRVLGVSAKINIVDGDEGELHNSLAMELFPRRYIPEYVIGGSGDQADALIHYRVTGEGFSIIGYRLGEEFDEYHVAGGLPRPYINESPYFFLLQVLTRLLVKKGYLVLTDSVSYIDDGGRIHLVLGYPHDGKSSLLVIALSMGGKPLTTENTVLSLTDDGLRIVNGTRILVYDPRVFEIYGLKPLKPDSTTKHGYHILDLGRGDYTSRKLIVDDITLIHSSFKSHGVEFEVVSGRKIMKTLWYFSTGLLRGLDYYSPYPLTLSNGLEDSLIDMLERVRDLYRGRFREAFGSHIDVYRGLARD